MPRWPSRLRRSPRRAWVRPGNDITRAIEEELRAPALPSHLPAAPAPVPAPLAPDAKRETPGRGGRPSSAA